ncbi:hypothetical protein CYMTET_44256 [Cymbomonas tetramitiformis]|uniref:Uncharacterized protein n=1 Tax=Cymbomonas tetramitiformis TaxID=36881 RepID=A0AAE0EZI4_9CHLO|nr:hypothetical protein CYMTET_44256 [Cymbomonas tetramitiformis]
MIQLRASMESDATVHGGANALRAKLAFNEEKVHAGTGGLVIDSVLTKWLKESGNQKAKAVMNTHAKASDRQGGKARAAELAKDGYHVVGIDPAFQENMQLDARVELFQCGALPFGWYDSPRILVKAVKVLVEWLRSPRSAADRQAVGKLQSRSKVHRRAGGCRREEHQ